jgi:hypothetical protein
VALWSRLSTVIADTAPLLAIRNAAPTRTVAIVDGRRFAK